MKVKIKTWEQMEEQYGLDRDGDIEIRKTGYNICFVRSMEDKMPTDRIINIIPDDNLNDRYLWGCWTISPEMIETFFSDIENQPVSRFIVPHIAFVPACRCDITFDFKKPRIKKRNYNLNY